MKLSELGPAAQKILLFASQERESQSIDTKGGVT